MASLNNLTGVSTSYVAAADGHQVIYRPSDLRDDQRKVLTHVLFPAKQNLMGPNCPAPTTDEVNRFLHDVFDFWASGRYHALPLWSPFTAGMLSKTVAIASLDEPVPSDKEVRAELNRRNLSMKVAKRQEYERFVGDYNMQTAHRDRMRGAIVRMRASVENGVIGTQLVTANGALLPATCKMTYLDGMSKQNAYYDAFRVHDEYEVEHVNDYNIGVALFIARNLITTWANGADVSAEPVEEAFEELIDLMMPVETIRGTATVFSDPEMYRACEMVKFRPRPTLY